MANGSLANGKAKSPTPATNPIGKPFNLQQKCLLLREPDTETKKERARESAGERTRESHRDSLWLWLSLSDPLSLSLALSARERASKSQGEPQRFSLTLSESGSL